jgi:hypothetical protein
MVTPKLVVYIILVLAGTYFNGYVLTNKNPLRPVGEDFLLVKEPSLLVL